MIDCPRSGSVKQDAEVFVLVYWTLVSRGSLYPRNPAFGWCPVLRWVPNRNDYSDSVRVRRDQSDRPVAFIANAPRLCCVQPGRLQPCRLFLVKLVSQLEQLAA